MSNRFYSDCHNAIVECGLAEKAIDNAHISAAKALLVMLREHADISQSVSDWADGFTHVLSEHLEYCRGQLLNDMDETVLFEQSRCEQLLSELADDGI